MICKDVANERVEAPMTIPGIPASFEMKEALRSRIGVRFALECSNT